MRGAQSEHQQDRTRWHLTHEEEPREEEHHRRQPRGKESRRRGPSHPYPLALGVGTVGEGVSSGAGGFGGVIPLRLGGRAPRPAHEQVSRDHQAEAGHRDPGTIGVVLEQGDLGAREERHRAEEEDETAEGDGGTPPADPPVGA